jgi:hypothetical protein
MLTEHVLQYESVYLSVVPLHVIGNEQEDMPLQ